MSYVPKRVRHAFLSIPLRGEAPKKCSTFLSGFKHKMKIISITKRGASHFSSDLERAPGARSIAVEKCEAPLLVTEIWQRAYPDILRSHDHFMGASPRVLLIATGGEAKLDKDKGTSIDMLETASRTM